MGKQAHGFIYRHGYDMHLNISNQFLIIWQMRYLLECQCFVWSDEWTKGWGFMECFIGWFSSSWQEWTNQPYLSLKMQLEAKPSKYTLATLLVGCANIPALNLGKVTHRFLIRNGYDTDVVIRGPMVDMQSYPSIQRGSYTGLDAMEFYDPWMLS